MLVGRLAGYKTNIYENEFTAGSAIVPCVEV